ncbi:MAG: hypothetical protein R3F15_02025 [Lysobacterales bacterium]
MNADICDKIVVLPVRFNFLHKGHEAYIRSVLQQDVRQVYIFLGRCNAVRVSSDPFDDVERRFMIDAFLNSIAGASDRVRIFPVFNRALGTIVWSEDEVQRWYGYCADILARFGLPRWDAVISGNPYAGANRKLQHFVNPYDLVPESEQVYMPCGKPLCATFVRNLLYADDLDWQAWVSEATASIVRSQLKRLDMASGPLEALSHRVVCNLPAASGTAHYSQVIADGEFKDQVARSIILRHFSERFSSAEVAITSEPYTFALSGVRGVQAVSLSRIVRSETESSLEYVFDVVG